MDEIKVTEIFDSTTGKWVVAKHESVVIESDLEMTQRIVCQYYEDSEGTVGMKTTDYISALPVQPEERNRLKSMYKDFSFSRSTRGRYVNPSTQEPVEIYDTQTGEILPGLVEGVDYISERTLWQSVPLIEGITTIADNVYQLINQNILKMRNNNLNIQ